MRPKGAGVVAMIKTKIKKVISGAVAVAAAAAIIGGSIAAVNARKPISVAERPAAVKTSDQPFVTEVTGESKNFRIPAMITLESGRIVASADARYDTTLDGGGLDTVVAYSDDSGATWTSYTANHLGDNGNKFSKKSSAFIDSELIANGNNVWMMTTFYPGGRNLASWTGIKAAVAEPAFNEDGSLKISDNHGKSYDYKADINHFENGYSQITDGNGKDSGYKIDEYYYLYDASNNLLGNIFYIKSKMKFSVVPTTYLYMTKSENGGESFGAPKLINLKKADEAFYGVGPGRGICTSNGTLIFSAYVCDVKAGTQQASFIYSTDGGSTWQRSRDIESNDTFEYSSESQIVELSNGDLRCFFRNNSNRICYADAKLTGTEYIWSDPVVTETEISSACMLSAIQCTKGGKDYILISCPTGTSKKKGKTVHERSCGKIFAFEVDGAGNMTLTKTTDINDSAFMYSCMTCLNNGRIALLYESAEGEITYTVYAPGELI